MVRADERIGPIPPGRPAADAVLARHLIVDAPENGLLRVLVRGGEALARQRRGVREDRARLALVLVRGEVMHLVLDDRTAERAANLLILVRQHRPGDGVRRVELVVAEISVHAAREVVRPRARDRLHLQAGGAALRDLEHVGHDLKLRDGVAAESRLPEARPRDLLRDLLAVEIELEEVLGDARVVADLVGGNTLHQLGELEPVAALERHLLHLARVDVACHLRRSRIDKRRLSGDGDRLIDLCERERERHRRVLPDEQLDRRNDHRRKAAQVRLDLVSARRQVHHAVLASLVGHTRRLNTGGQVGGRDSRSRQDCLGRVGDGAEHRRLLRKRRRGESHQQGYGEHDDPFGAQAHDCSPSVDRSIAMAVGRALSQVVAPG